MLSQLIKTTKVVSVTYRLLSTSVLLAALVKSVVDKKKRKPP